VAVVRLLFYLVFDGIAEKICCICLNLASGYYNTASVCTVIWVRSCRWKDCGMLRMNMKQVRTISLTSEVKTTPLKWLTTLTASCMVWNQMVSVAWSPLSSYVTVYCDRCVVTGVFSYLPATRLVSLCLSLFLVLLCDVSFMHLFEIALAANNILNCTF